MRSRAIDSGVGRSASAGAKFKPGTGSAGTGRKTGAVAAAPQLVTAFSNSVVTKAGLNALARTLAGELRGTGVLVNAVCPGWVATDMGGTGAARSVDEGAAGIIWAATLPDQGPTGGFFRDGQRLTW